MAPGVLDRVAPSRREACRTRRSTRQTWRDLLFVHWEVPPSALRAVLPAPASIDLFEGRAFVGLVPFTMHAVQIGPLPIADFLETNLRTYVHTVPAAMGIEVGDPIDLVVASDRGVAVETFAAEPVEP